MQTQPQISQLNTQSQIITHTENHTVTQRHGIHHITYLPTLPDDMHSCSISAPAAHTHTHIHTVMKTNMQSHLHHTHSPSSQSAVYFPHKVTVSQRVHTQTPPNAGIGLHWPRVNTGFPIRIPSSYAQSLSSTHSQLLNAPNIFILNKMHVFLLPSCDLGSLKSMSFQLTCTTAIVASSAGQLFLTVSSCVCELCK